MEEKVKEFNDLDWEEKKLVWRIRALSDIMEHGNGKMEPDLYPDTSIGIAGILEDTANRLEAYLLTGE